MILGRVKSVHYTIVRKESDIRIYIFSNVIDVYQELGWTQHRPLRDSRCDFGRARGFTIDDYLMPEPEYAISDVPAHLISVLSVRSKKSKGNNEIKSAPVNWLRPSGVA